MKRVEDKSWASWVEVVHDDGRVKDAAEEDSMPRWELDDGAEVRHDSANAEEGGHLDGVGGAVALHLVVDTASDVRTEEQMACA
jgi:hypothetical protein